MTPKEKAKELVLKYWNLPTTFQYINDGVIFVENSHINKKAAKQCALIAVDEILKAIKSTPADYGSSWTYWEQVKNEIEKL